MTEASLYSAVADLEDDIGAIEDIAQLLSALASSRNDMPCAALSPLASATLSHVERLDAAFKALHRMVGGRDPCA